MRRAASPHALCTFALGFLCLAGCADGSEAPPPTGGGFPDSSTGPGWSLEAGSLEASVWPEAGLGGGAGAALPADVCKVLQDNACLTCHSQPPAGGAPIPFTLREHFANTAPDGSSFGQRALVRMQDAQRPMPPATTGRALPAAGDIAVFKAWVDNGMPGVAGGECTPSTSGGKNSDAPDWAQKPWPEGECEWVMTVGAHGKALTPVAQDPSGYPVPAQETSYQCFYEKVPWGDKKVQALAMRVRVETPDDKALVHHLVISGREPGQESIAGASPSGPGDHKPCDNPSGSTLGVWAPGAQDPITFPDDVGVLLPSGNDAYIEMQVHYNNTSSAAGKQSRVAYDICVTSKLRPQTAGVHWLGFENAVLAIPSNGLPRLDNQGNGTAIGKCKAKQRARILWMAPHMHELGRHTKVEVVRKDGTVETVLDKPFDFREQTAYFRDNFWVEQGETVRTTCKWDTSRKIYFGFASDEEMCFVYTLAYPAGAFRADLLAFETGVVGGNLACAGATGP